MGLEVDSWIGILGGGQLGRMLSLDARRMGFKVLTWTGGDLSGAANTADQIIDDPFEDPKALEKFSSSVNVATVEFENLPREILEHLEQIVPLHPSSHVVSICQNREREKKFLSQKGFSCAEFKIADDYTSFHKGVAEMNAETIVKTAEFGYDGKGQQRLQKNASEELLQKTWKTFDNGRVVIEECISLEAEISVIVARSTNGEIAIYDPAENIHRNHILDISIVPARIDPLIIAQAKEVSLAIVDELQYVGILAIEFFVSSSGKLLVNELAPRPHNSGHHTINSCFCSQFENQARAISGLPLGSTHLHSSVVMMNLLGDVWAIGKNHPDFASLLSTPGTSLHLYGKNGARLGRKMGHVTFTGENQNVVLDAVNKARELLSMPKI